MCLRLTDLRLKLSQGPYSINGLESADAVWDQDPPNTPSPNPLRLPTPTARCKRGKNPPKTQDLSSHKAGKERHGYDVDCENTKGEAVVRADKRSARTKSDWRKGKPVVWRCSGGAGVQGCHRAGEEAAWSGAGQRQDPLLPTVPGAEHTSEPPSCPQMASLFPRAAPAPNPARTSREGKAHLSHSRWFVGAKRVPGMGRGGCWGPAVTHCSTAPCDGWCTSPIDTAVHEREPSVSKHS